MVRRLAARILDQSHAPPPEHRVTRLLGQESCGFLMPYLNTRGPLIRSCRSHSGTGAAAPAIPSLMERSGFVGRTLLANHDRRNRMAAAGAGVAVQHLAALSFEGSFPFIMRSREASLLEDACPSRRLWDRFPRDRARRLRG